MSNTSTVTPYVAAGAGAEAIANSIAECATATIRWLTEETETDRRATAELGERRRRERLFHAPDRHAVTGSAGSVTTARLHLRSPASLVRAAEHLGYRIHHPATNESRTARGSTSVFLRNDEGERLAIESTRDGRVALHTSGDRARIHRVVRQHTVERAIDHFAARGLEVRTASVSTGEVQIIARERASGQVDGAAIVKAQVGSDGGAWVDVDGVQGSRCEKIVVDLATAVGGKVGRTRGKSEVVRLPTGPARKRVRS